MPPKNAKPTSDELLAQFDDLGINAKTDNKQPASTRTTAATTSTGQSEQDILAELDNLASQRPSSGPGTPRLSSTEPRSSTRSPRPTGRTSEDRPPVRKSGESGRSSRTANRNAPQPSSSTEKTVGEESSQSSNTGGGWWGGLFATANAAMKQAEAAVKEIQQNEEAQKWAQQVKGNVGALRELGIGL